MADAILGHARRDAPSEACGLIVGSAQPAEGGVARRYVPCRNAAALPSRYVVHRDDLLAVLAELDRTGEELWGVVHSHVRSAAVPSATDIAEAAWPAAVYVLASLAESAEAAPLRAWRIVDGIARELDLELADVPVEGAA
ncbi:MAG: M67 family metallopeptidase [Chloroflexota bacterium]